MTTARSLSLGAALVASFAVGMLLEPASARATLPGPVGRIAFDTFGEGRGFETLSAHRFRRSEACVIKPSSSTVAVRNIALP